MLSSTNWHLCEWIIGLKGVLYPNLFLCDTALFMTRFVTFSQNKSTSSSRDSVLYLFIPWQNNIQFVPLNLVLTRWMMTHLFLVWDVALGSRFNYAEMYFPNTETMVSWATSNTLYTRKWHWCKCISCMQHVSEHVTDWNYRRQVIWHYQIWLLWRGWFSFDLSCSLTGAKLNALLRSSWMKILPIVPVPFCTKGR